MPFFDSIRIGASGAAEDFSVDRSLRFNRDDEAYLETTLGNSNLNKWTLSVWVKKAVNGEHQAILASGDSGVYTMVNFGNSDRIKFTNYPGSNAGIYITTRKFRDPSAWFHIVAIWDSGNSTAGDRIRIYVDGVRETEFDQSDNPNQDQNSVINGNTQGGSDWGNGKHRVGRFSNYTDYTGCYYAEVNFVDGQAYDPSYFAETNALTGQWNPKKYSGSYGTNGFYLKFSDNSGTTATTLGKDSSGNGHNFTPYNFSVSAGAGNDSVEDTPTNNFCTMNPIDKHSSISTKNGNLQVGEGNDWRGIKGTFGVSSGKWYYEFKTGNANIFCGWASDDLTGTNNITTNPQDSNSAMSLGVLIFCDDGRYQLDTGGSGTRVSYSSALAVNDVLGCAIDLDNNTAQFYKQGSALGSIDISSSNLATKKVMPYFICHPFSNPDYTFNFGQQAFAYTPPTGYNALSSANLPDPTILLPNNHFDTILYTGNGSTTQNITGYNFQPDWVWIKSRSSGSGHHSLIDSVRGDVALNSNLTIAEYAVSAFNFNATSIDVPYYANDYSMNTNSATYVAWNWNAGDTDGKTYTVTVVDDSGNKFRFDGYGTSAVTLELAEGGTYIFNYPSGHPFRFSTTSDGTHGGGSEYTTGVTHNSSTQVTLVVAASAPTLYYYCSSHSGMGGQVNTNSTLGSSNFDGSRQSIVKVNTTAGFSIVTSTAGGSSAGTYDSFGHGLGVAPNVIFFRNVEAADNWYIYFSHFATAYSKISQFNTIADYSSSNFWGTSNPTSSTFTVLQSAYSLGAGNRTLAYCFSEVAGYSKFGVYQANGNDTDGPFVFTGFRPAVVFIKTSSLSNTPWILFDNKRNTFNKTDKVLEPNTSDAETTDNYSVVDFLANGFKIKGLAGSFINYNSSYPNNLYIAFAESPFKNARAR